MRGKTAALVMVLIAASVLVVGNAVIGDLLERVTVPSTGTVKAIGVGVYWDSGCTSQVTSIDWGTVEPGATKSVIVFIKNEGSAPATLSLETENWNPSTASSYISLSWDYAGTVVDVDDVVQVLLSLSVSDTIVGITSFSFDIVIIGSG